ncbi:MULTISPECIES: DoxX family protein [Bacillaceae]|uniref:DoxX family protein n=1 Tax=Metabacillus sediminis TaxID=3117746 RepID=A0ABZ2NJ95_9BACI|nr:DoxX family protein [Bacillus sp. SJS]KZZ84056.1 oxidoreductase [Bacillus sp. SJS]
MLNHIGTLIIRFVLGIIFILHGYMKFAGGIEQTAEFFASLGLPGFMAYAVAVIELAGGILILIGLGTRIVSVLIAIIMLGAIFTVGLKKGFIGGYELDAALLAMALSLAFTGSGAYSAEGLLKKRSRSAS